MKQKNKKSILVVCQHYAPEPFRVTDICEELVRMGFEVQVVTGYPNYPEGKIYPGYGFRKHTNEVVNGVKIHRSFTVPRKTGTLMRIINYYSFSIFSTLYVFFKCLNPFSKFDFDVVLCNQLSPIMMASAGKLYKKIKKVPGIMYCMDLWPESLVVGGISRDSLIYKYYHHVSRKIYRSMDKILVTSRRFSDYLNKEFSISKDCIEYLPQYAESLFDSIPVKHESEKTNLLFAGNIGSAQSVDTILKAAELLIEEPVVFHIIGGGSELDRLKDEYGHLENIVFYGRRPLEEMPKFYAMADAMLITLIADPVLSLTIPGKVQSYMAAGKPIIGSIDGECQDVINDAGCGFCGKAEDYEQLAENIKRFIYLDEKQKEDMAKKSKTYYTENFDRDLFFNNLINRF